VIFSCFWQISKIFSVNFILWWAPFDCGPVSIAYPAYTIATALDRGVTVEFWERFWGDNGKFWLKLKAHKKLQINGLNNQNLKKKEKFDRNFGKRW
jgi:hypothetical protein